MPSNTEAQRKLFALALSDPGKLYKKNRGLANLPMTTLREFATRFKGKKRKA